MTTAGLSLLAKGDELLAFTLLRRLVYAWFGSVLCAQLQYRAYCCCGSQVRKLRYPID